MSDQLGRKRLIVAGMLLQAVAIAGFVALPGLGWWITESVVLGAGTALVYPTLLAVISDVARIPDRATSVGIYRLWRDAGYAVGAIVAGVIADAAGFSAAIVTVAALTGVSGIIVAIRMRESKPNLFPIATATIHEPGSQSRES
jgi:MFS family permease